MLKKVKGTMDKELKKIRKLLSQQKRISIQRQKFFLNNQTEVLKLECPVTEMKDSLEKLNSKLGLTKVIIRKVEALLNELTSLRHKKNKKLKYLH